MKSLRHEIDLSQEALGAQGFVSAPGWIKIENGQRQASEKLIDRMLKWLVGDKYIKANSVSGLREELLVLKYLGSNSAFVREMAKLHARHSLNVAVVAAGESAASAKNKARPKVKTLPVLGKKAPVAIKKRR